MPGSKPGALPLGDTPTEISHYATCHQNYGWGTRIRTWVCQDQNLVPYRLAIPHLNNDNLMNVMVREARLELAHLAAPEPKSGASTNFATPAKDGGYDGNRTCDPSIMSAVL